MQVSSESPDLSQMGSKGLGVNIPAIDTSLHSDIATDNVSLQSADPLPAQYSYDSFDEVLDWISHFSVVFASKYAPVLFQSHLRLRDHYLSQGNAKGVESVENLIKNDIGICRFEEETEDFRQKFAGKSAKFWRGKFIGWSGEVPYDPSLKGVMCYEL
jgi:hypothetical protein